MGSGAGERRRSEPSQRRSRLGAPVHAVACRGHDLLLSAHRLERVLHRAEHLRLLDARALTARLAELPGRRARALHAGLATLAYAEPQITRSELEDRFLSLVAGGDLPAPECNQRIGRHEVDVLWRAQRLVAELDGAATHLTRRAFEADRRDADLQVRGFRVVRCAWGQVAHEPHAVARTLRALLHAA